MLIDMACAGVLVFMGLGVAYRLRHSFLDSDFGGLHYPGYFRAKGDVSKEMFRNDLIGSPGNKTFVQYLNWILYRVAGPRVARVRMFYGLWLSAAVLVFYYLMKRCTGDSLAAFAGSFYFVLWGGHPLFFAHFECAERYALGHSVIHLGLVLVSMADGSLWAAGLAGLVFLPMPLLHKPLYVFEGWAALIVLWLFGPLWSPSVYAGVVLVTGVVIFIPLPYETKKKLVEGIFNVNSGFYRYWLFHDRKEVLTSFAEKWSLFSPPLVKRFAAAFIPCLAVLVHGQADHLVLVSLVMLASSFLMVMVQFRFYPYQFLPVILPMAMVISTCFACSPDLWVRGVVLTILGFQTLELLWILSRSDEDLNHRTYRKIVHYKNRNEAAGRIGDLLLRMNPEKEPVLVWGDTPQIYLYCGAPSSYPFLEVTQQAIGPYGNKQACLLDQLRRNPPGFIAVMMNTVNWKTLEALTGRSYRLAASVTGGDEWFPVYETAGKRGPGEGDAPVDVGDLFIECLNIRADRKIFNPKPHAGNHDPNPTVPWSEPFCGQP